MAKKDSRSKVHRKLAGGGEAEARKIKKNHTAPALDGKEMEPYDNKARKKEKEIEAAAAAAVERGIDNNDGVPKPKKSRRKLLQETVLESDVVLAKEKRKDKTRVKSSAAIEDAAQETRSEVKEIRKNVTVLDDSDVFPGGSPALDGNSRKSESKAGEREKAAPRAPDNTVAVETALVPDKGDKKSKKSKKRKHAESLLVDDETATPALDVTAEGQSPRKKRHKGNSKIIDPGQDKSLSEQALKALSYAFSQYGNPAEWKFNKARQNWLIRNVWLPATIPDEYMPLLLWYLKNVKGGTRDALIKTCQTHLQPLTIPESQSKGESTASGPTEAETTTTSLFGLSAEILARPSDKSQETKRSRAKIILEVLEVQ